MAVPENYEKTISEDGLTVTNKYIDSEKPSNPKTGDNGVMYLIAVVVVLGLALFFISKNKKK